MDRPTYETYSGVFTLHGDCIEFEYRNDYPNPTGPTYYPVVNEPHNWPEADIEKVQFNGERWIVAANPVSHYGYVSYHDETAAWRE
ncbi:hypothetical protein [Kitasatospora sp. MBT66]|uniref:hypothetical protein n=1 Tax=Kitasatospora sp. MBT66 TaxID=1444769 RepID=UPI0011EA6ADE|nr:hypothetical protein [Kitasatospora sp. MBT66]